MSKFTIRTADQLSLLLPALRKEAGLTQREAALRLGVKQQTYSAFERNAEAIGVSRLLKLLNILGAELILSKPDTAAPAAKPMPGQPPW